MNLNKVRWENNNEHYLNGEIEEQNISREFYIYIIINSDNKIKEIKSKKFFSIILWIN